MGVGVLVALLLCFHGFPFSIPEVIPNGHPPLVPRDVLFSTYDRFGVTLSPDGKYIGFFAPYKGMKNIWEQEVNGTEGPRRLTEDMDNSIRSFAWTHLPHVIVFLKDFQGDENFQLHSLNASSGDIQAFTPFGSRAAVYKQSSRLPDTLMVGVNDRDTRFFDVFRLDLLTGELTRILENDRFKGFIFDNNLALRLACEAGLQGNDLYFEPSRNESGEIQDWELYRNVSMMDIFGTAPLGFDGSNKKICWRDTVGRNFSALVIKDFAEPESVGDVLFANDTADFFSVVLHPKNKRPVSVLMRAKLPEVILLESEFKPHYDNIAEIQELGGENHFPYVFDYSLDFKNWLVFVQRDDGPGEYFLYFVDSMEMKFLFVQKEKLLEFQLSRMRAVEVESRDGLVQVCFLTIPIEEEQEDGMPARPLPMVLFVHGGPWLQNTWGYNSGTQLLANRGYAVLQCNYRVSTGYGKAHVAAGFGEWGRKMHDDLVDAVNWAVQARVADPDRVAIFGGSYGGYATLVGLTFTPQLFSCGVNLVGISNLESFLNSIPDYWQPFFEFLVRAIGGDPRTEEGREFLKQRSPLTFAKRIERPLMIAHGANDPRVKRAESDQIVMTMQDAAIPVTYLMYPDEGHGFGKPQNRIAFTAVMEQFLFKCLGGRAEPLGDDLTASSVQVLDKGLLDLPTTS